jgi:hypothetical protein
MAPPFWNTTSHLGLLPQGGPWAKQSPDSHTRGKSNEENAKGAPETNAAARHPFIKEGALLDDIAQYLVIRDDPPPSLWTLSGSSDLSGNGKQQTMQKPVDPWLTSKSSFWQAEGANIWSADLARSKSDLNSAKEWPPKPSQENVLECIADLDSMISPLIDAPIFEPDFGTESPKTKAAPPGPEPRTTFAATPVSLEITCALPQQHSPQQQRIEIKSDLRASAPPFIPKWAQGPPERATPVTPVAYNSPMQSPKHMMSDSPVQSPKPRPNPRAKAKSLLPSKCIPCPTAPVNGQSPKNQDDNGQKHFRDAPDWDSTICLDWVKGTCDESRWKCKFAHPTLPFDVLPGHTIIETLMSMYGIVPEEGAKVCEVWLLTGSCKFGRLCWNNHPSLPPWHTATLLLSNPSTNSKTGPKKRTKGSKPRPQAKE